MFQGLNRAVCVCLQTMPLSSVSRPMTLSEYQPKEYLHFQVHPSLPDQFVPRENA